MFINLEDDGFSEREQETWEMITLSWHTASHFPRRKSGLLEKHSYLVAAESGWALDPFTQNLWMLLFEPGKSDRRIVGLLWVVFLTVLIQFSSVALLLLLSYFSRVRLCATPSLGFSRQEHWSGLPFPSPMHESEKWKWSRSVMSDFSRSHGLQPTRLHRPWDFPGKSTGVGCHCLNSLPLPNPVLRQLQSGQLPAWSVLIGLWLSICIWPFSSLC